MILKYLFSGSLLLTLLHYSSANLRTARDDDVSLLRDKYNEYKDDPATLKTNLASDLKTLVVSENDDFKKIILALMSSRSTSKNYETLKNKMYSDNCFSILTTLFCS